MVRCTWKTRYEIEDCKAITVKFLKKHGYLKPNQWMRGGIKWSINGHSNGNVEFLVNTYENYIEFDYRTRQQGETEWIDRNYRVSLCTTPCNLGGIRYWFVCTRCGKRVGNLYLAGWSDFSCRNCLNLTYNSRNTSKKYRSIGKLFKSDEVEQKIAHLRVKYYRGRPTRRYAALLRRNTAYQRSMTSWEEFERQLYMS